MFSVLLEEAAFDFRELHPFIAKLKIRISSNMPAPIPIYKIRN
jgi:hypothetical protein